MSHFDLTVSSATINQLLGFLSAKGFAVDFDARSMTIYGPGSTGLDTDSSRGSSIDSEPITLEYWYAVTCGLKVGVCSNWPEALSYMVDEFGIIAPGTHALNFPTEAGARRAFKAAARRNEVEIIEIVRDYVIVE